MNYNTAIFLVNTKVRAIKAVYQPDVEGKPREPRVLYKTLDPSITVGDYILVPTETRHKMSVFRVTDVDVEIDFDDTTLNPKWVIGVVDREEYERTVDMESAAIERIRSAEKRRKQEELRKSLLNDNPDLQALTFAPAATDPEPNSSTT